MEREKAASEVIKTLQEANAALAETLEMAERADMPSLADDMREAQTRLAQLGRHNSPEFQAESRKRVKAINAEFSRQILRFKLIAAFTVLAIVIAVIVFTK